MAEKYREIVQKLDERSGSRLMINISERKSCFKIDAPAGFPAFVVKTCPELEILGSDKSKPLLEEISDMLGSKGIGHTLMEISTNLPMVFQDSSELIEVSRQLSLKVEGKMSNTLKNSDEDMETNKKIRELINEIEDWISRSQ